MRPSSTASSPPGTRRRRASMIRLTRSKAGYPAPAECDPSKLVAAENARGDFLAARDAAQQAASYLTVAQRTVFQVPDDAQLVFAADHPLEACNGTAARSLG